MDDSLAMRRFERAGYFNSSFQRLIEWQRPSLQTRCQRFPFDVFHDQKFGTVLRAYVVQRADVRMIQRRDSAGFALETLPRFRSFGQMLGKNLDCDGAVEPGVARAVDLAHAARA